MLESLLMVCAFMGPPFAGTTACLRPYFLGGWHLRGVPLDSHDVCVWGDIGICEEETAETLPRQFSSPQKGSSKRIFSKANMANPHFR